MDSENEMKEEEPKEKKYHTKCTIGLSKNTPDETIQSLDENEIVRDTKSGFDCTSSPNSPQSSDPEVAIEEENHHESLYHSDPEDTVELENHHESLYHSSPPTVFDKSELPSVEQEEEIIEEELSDDAAYSTSQIPQYENIRCDSNRIVFGLCQAKTPQEFQGPLLNSSEVSLKLLELEKERFETEREYMLKKLENKKELLELKKRKLMIRMEIDRLKKFKYGK